MVLTVYDKSKELFDAILQTRKMDEARDGKLHFIEYRGIVSSGFPVIGRIYLPAVIKREPCNKQ